jgi:DNA (cytosine-5)-methyltransferase 1
MTHGSLFSGIGGFDLAAQWMGWENVFQVEWDGFCQKVLAKNFPNVTRYGDIREFDGRKYKGSIDVISGGFPCQDTSNAKTWTSKGENLEEGIDGKRTGLWWYYLKIIEVFKPNWVTGENVDAIRYKGLNFILQSLAEIGYDAEWKIISASKFGAPHKRERCWIVAYPNSIRRNEESLIFGKKFDETIQKASQWELSRTICSNNGKKTLPNSLGIYDGIPRELYDAERIKALGNAIVPQVAFQIFKAIEQYDMSRQIRNE